MEMGMWNGDRDEVWDEHRDEIGLHLHSTV